MVQEILANRCQVLTAEALLLLKLVLSVSEAAALLLLAVFARLSIEPELAEFSLDLFLPSVLDLDSCSGSTLGGACAGSHGLALRLLQSRVGNGRVESVALEVDALIV